nr:DUF1353 domain-containing protein [Yoonia sediminilitoris]
MEAAIVHDFLYVAWQGIPGGTANGCDRRFADRVMLATMKSSGVGLLRRWCIFAAVRFGGGRTFRKPDHLRFGDATDPRLIYLAAVSDLMAPT